MKKFVNYILIISILASLLAMTGCIKKTPTPTTPLPTETQPMPTETEPVPTETEPVPTETQPLPTETEPVPTETQPLPTETVAVCEHVLGNWIVEKTSTCTTEGSRYKSCTICEEKVETQAIPVLSHSPSQWIVEKAATCQQEGVQYQKCTQCDTRIITAQMAKAAHKEVVVKGKAATATKTGLTDGKKCTVCNEITLPQYVIPAGMEAVSFGYEVHSDKKSCSIVALNNEITGDVVVPDTFSGYTVTGIGEKAFENCVGITSITLPASVTAIGNSAFSGCTNLTKIVFEGTSAQWNAITKGTDWDANTGTYKVTCAD